MTLRGAASFTRVMDDDTLTERLRRMGREPVPSEVRDDHLHRMETVEIRPPREKRFGRVAVAAAAIVGFMAGSTGLAMAGALPDPAQGVAHDVLSVVQVEVPDPGHKNRGQCVSEKMKTFEGAPDDAETEAAKKSAKAECGVPGPPADRGVGKGAPGERGPKAHKHDGDPCKGPPPWARKGGPPDPQAKADFEATRAACPPDQADGEG